MLDLPFNRELAAGTLSRERFTFYTLQVRQYLTYFARALAVTAAQHHHNEGVFALAALSA